MPFRPCVILPTYDNPATLAAVVARVRHHLADVIIVDDGSGPAGRAAAEALARSGLARVHHHDRNRGKGAAVKTALALAREHGYTHALQADADGQHDLDRIPAFIAAAAAAPAAVVLGYPHYTREAPRARLLARRFTQFWVNLQTRRGVITDPMIGFRVYPTASLEVANRCPDRMDFDIEIAVRLVWAGLEIINLPVAVRYLDADEGGVSHFRMVRDNLRISWLHTRLTTIALFRALKRPFARLFRSPP